jgi:cytidylate kinase
VQCRTVTISRSLAAGGEEVGRLIAEAMGFRYVDDEIVISAANSAGIDASAVQRVEETPPLIQRMMEFMAMSAPPEVAGWDPVMAFPIIPSTSVRQLIQSVIRQTAEKGNAVILAHAASIPLAGTEGVLRVFVTASPEVRAQRLRSQAKLTEAEARKSIEDSDRQRREYLRRFYQVSQELPTLYDLVLNTDVLTPAEAAKIVVDLAKS